MADYTSGGITSVTTSLLADNAVTSAKIAANAVGDTEVNNSDSFTWTGIHTWSDSTPSSGFNVLTRLANTTAGENWRWTFNTNGELALRVNSGADAMTILTIDTLGALTLLERGTFSSNILMESFLQFGSGSSQMSMQYNSVDDSFDILDSVNSEIRGRLDRTTGDMSIDGALTEGATL